MTTHAQELVAADGIAVSWQELQLLIPVGIELAPLFPLTGQELEELERAAAWDGLRARGFVVDGDAADPVLADPIARVLGTALRAERAVDLAMLEGAAESRRLVLAHGPLRVAHTIDQDGLVHRFIPLDPSGVGSWLVAELELDAPDPEPAAELVIDAEAWGAALAGSGEVPCDASEAFAAITQAERIIFADTLAREADGPQAVEMRTLYVSSSGVWQVARGWGDGQVRVAAVAPEAVVAGLVQSLDRPSAS